MSVHTAKRRALSTISHQRSRLLHSSSASQAAALSQADLVEEEIEEISIQPIFDIFDAPTRLAESSEFIRAKYKTPTKAEKVPTQASLSPPPPIAPTPLPPPTIFDGPARPRNEVLAYRRRMRDSGLAPTLPPRPKPTPAARPFSSSEPLVQMFEGPARITRYNHQPSGNKEGSPTLILALGLAGGAAVCGTFAKEFAEAG
ncbi:hypothetical protein CVT26_010982 [Gymnopilus dilepis]|uniref:Uncharacterized protein n=1 Tax=Gymnopilus dilepis TaxID=231916 RepID=A0A409VYD1_9AGAR|nr:hypothetical protein CVT26_010982 [Gymnopilus dilepis]